MVLPKRTQQHRTETDSLSQLREHLGTDWVFRDHSERDYGIDVHIEYFDGDWPTGLVLYGQLKGTTGIFLEPTRLSGFPTKTANYANLFNIPFFVFYASLANKITKFVWLQEYLRLNIRYSQLSEQESITIVFPEENDLNEAGKQKILGILKQQHTAKAGLMFLTYYERLLQRVEALAVGNTSSAKSCLIQILEIQRLGLIQGSADHRDISISEFDFDRVIILLKTVIRRKSISADELRELEWLIFPLKFKKLELLNQDTQNAINSWLTSGKHY